MYMNKKIRLLAYQMSNICYNLKQGGNTLRPEDRQSMAQVQEAFDAAMNEQRDKEKKGKHARIRVAR